MKIRWRLIAGLAILAASVGFFALWSARTEAVVRPVVVAMVTTDVSQGAIIVRNDIERLTLPKLLAPPQAVNLVRTQTVVGQRALVPLFAGQVLVTGEVGGIVPAVGNVTVTIPVSLATFGGAQPGDWVSVGVSSGPSGAATWLFAAHPVRLLSLLDGSGHPMFGLGQGNGGGGFPGGGSTPSVAVLAMTPAQASQLLPYQGAGNLELRVD